MAFNKNKALDNALKFLNQGKIPQAIAEYQHILRVDPKDQATLMTVGDLYARQGQMPQAIEYFERLAQVYLNDGFNSKAIAIYKKIAKLAPTELAPLERLADLYVQQGVLSEARPLFLQIAEAHFKANRAPKAVEALNRLLEVEPENPRVQMRLAELYNLMGKKKEASQTYLGYAHRLFDRDDPEEAQKLIERALEADPSNASAYLLKAKILIAANHSDQAIVILERHHPEADDGGDVTDLILDLELKSGQTQKAAERARKQLARGQTHFAPLLLVADAMIEGGGTAEALPLLRELRDPMIEAGEHDKFLKSLSTAVERLPGQTEPLEMMADFCRHTSDPFPLNAALSQLSEAYIALGNTPKAEELLQELVDRNKDDERLVRRLNQLRNGGGAAPKSASPAEIGAEASHVQLTDEPAQPEAPLVPEEPLDEETQRYVSQALTDVDLFSSYGLTQKASHLLESVLERAPRHTPTLERLLDMYLGAGNERRTAELAAQLEQIVRGRGDTVNAERFAELRQRFQTAAGLTNEELLSAMPSAVEQHAAIEPSSVGAVPVDEVHARPASPSGPAEFDIPSVALDPEPEGYEPPIASAPVEAQHGSHDLQPALPAEEVDLSDEWEAMGQEVGEDVPATASANAHDSEVIEIGEDRAPTPMQAEVSSAEGSAAMFEIVEETVPEAASPEASAPASDEIELLLTPEPMTPEGNEVMETTQDLINQLVAELDDLDAPAPAHIPTIAAGSNGTPASAAGAVPEQTSDISGITADNLNELAGIFKEFRSDIGELAEDEEEDLETHYNLGIAYREMGLLDEAIGEFQKVAKAVQKGKPFPYAMNCSTLLALTFMDKGEPKIASLWYKRALEVPALDPETILALRYDLAVSLETAGESSAALDSFRQVYAMNIDYRDVAGHIATLQKS
jgi:tetratricopeptide (TPR) repeat protein